MPNRPQPDRPPTHVVQDATHTQRVRAGSAAEARRIAVQHHGLTPPVIADRIDGVREERGRRRLDGGGN